MRPMCEQEQIQKAKIQSCQSDILTSTGRVTLVLVNKDENRREYFCFSNNELEMYDRIGRAPDQVQLKNEELEAIRDYEGVRARARTAHERVPTRFTS